MDVGGRRAPPGQLTPQPAPESVLVLDNVGVHKNEAVQKRLNDRYNITTIMIPGCLKTVIRPCDRTVNEEFERSLNALYTAWALDQTRGEANIKRLSSSREQVATWVKDLWWALSLEVIRR